MATSAQIPLNFKQIISSDKHLNIATKPGIGVNLNAPDNHNNYQRSSNPGTSQNQMTNKSRKQSTGHRINTLMHGAIDQQVVVAALKQLGNVAQAGMMTSASKERVRKTPQMHAQPIKSSMGLYSNESHYNAQGSQSSSNIQAKRNSKLIMAPGSNQHGSNQKGINLQQAITLKSMNIQGFDGYQNQIKSATAEKRRNFKSTTKVGAFEPQNQPYYHPNIASSGIFHQQKRRVSSTSTGGVDSQSHEHFQNNFMMNTTVDNMIQYEDNDQDEEVLRVEDYNNQASQSYFTQQQRTGPAALRISSGFDDTEGDYYPRLASTSALSKKKRQYNRLDQNNDYQNFDEDVRVPAFLVGRSSLENNNRDKGQFYMTQVLSQTNSKAASHSAAKSTSQSNTLKVNRSAKLKSSSKKQTVTSSSALAKQYALSTMKNLTTQQRLALLAGVGSSQQLDKREDSGFHLSSQELVRQQSAQKRTSAVMLSQTGLVQSANEGFFNSTAPINMQKINSGVGLDNNQQRGLDKSRGGLMISHSKDSTSLPKQHSYYNSGSNLRKNSAVKKKSTTMNTTHLEQSQSLSPLKHLQNILPTQKQPGLTGKKQLLIQSLLNTATSGSGEPLQPKALLNVTLQNLIQQQQSKLNTTSNQLINRGPLLTHNRMNKTLDTSSIEVGVKQTRGQSATRGATQKIGKDLGKKSKISSTMRASDFNQTQQIQDIKGQIMQDDGRKSKNSLKSTQNVQLVQDELNDPRKQSALSIYTQNVQPQGKGQRKSKVNQTQKTHQKKPSNEHHHYDQNEREMLKKMMNFYQDDFLAHFNIKQASGVEVPKVISKTSGQKSSLQKQQYNISNQPGASKHKANSTLNYYLQQNQQMIQFEPQQLLQPMPESPDIESKEIVLAARKKETVKEFQNKTQPIPKNILEMGAQTGIAANVSTGTNGMGNVVKGHGSIESEVVITYQPKVELPKQLVAQAQPQTTQAQKKQNPQKMENPADYYSNKRNQILEDDLLPGGSSDDNQHLSNQTDHEDSDSESDDDGNRKLAKFVLGKQVGQGAYAVVRIASLKKDPSQKFAIKVYDKSKLTDINRQRSVRREIKLLQKMNHPNIVKIFEAFETDDNVYLVMEYVGGGSLHSYLKEKPDRRLEEEDAKRIFKQLMTALQYCHRKSIAHRDIKLENILIDDNNNVKLIDFGFSTCIPNDKKIKMFCGTPSYMAPEIVMKEEYAGPPADIWASAVLLYALMNGCFPYRGATDKELYRRIQRGSFVLHNQSVTDYFVALLEKMLNVVADDRPTADDILKDQWFIIDSSSQAAKAQQQRNQAESIADQKRAFKAKILGKIPVEKTKNTICLNASNQDQIKNLNRGSSNANSNPAPGPVQISGSGTIAGNQSGNYQVNQNNNDFSDYGLQQQNVIKRLNYEAYQAYYNTSGANFGMSGSGTIQNPYYNNFFQNTPFVNTTTQQQQQNNLGFYPGVFSNNVQGTGGQVRSSPSKTTAPIAQQPTAPTTTGPFAFPTQPPQLNSLGAHQSTPQVFGSPTSPPPFHCTGGMINNNFNIINNIIMNPAVGSPQGGTQATKQAEVAQSPKAFKQKDEIISPGNIMIIEPENEEDLDEDDELDEEIVGSMEKLGFNRSQIITDIIKDKNTNSQVGQIYTRLKEEKLSKTSKHRAHSMQPNRKPNHLLAHVIGKQNHNHAIFPNFVPSIPEDNSSMTRKYDDFEGTQKLMKYNHGYYDDVSSGHNNDDYHQLLLASGQKSPKGSSAIRLNQTQQYQLFPMMRKEKELMSSGIIGQKL